VRDCWPDWLRRRSNQVFGPGIEDAIPYPVYQVQPPVVSSDNPNVTSSSITPASVKQSYSHAVATANLDTTIFQINPNNVYDTITCVAFDLNGTLSVPIFLSFDKPGRTNQGIYVPDGPEAAIWTGCALLVQTVAGFDLSSLPNWVDENVPPQANQTPYSALYFTTPCTNQPFYLWFNNGTGAVNHPSYDGAPTPGIVFKASWFVRGR
jgi:hypothetical protein